MGKLVFGYVTSKPVRTASQQEVEHVKNILVQRIEVFELVNFVR
jgi:hypothetical protein